jgi:transcriptional regulator with XRE-family HTH domain
MTPAELFNALMERHALTPQKLARALNREKMQAQFWRFANGSTTEPRVGTLQPIATYFKIPLSALQSVQGATQYAAEHGIQSARQPPRPAEPVGHTRAAGTVEEALQLLRERLDALPAEDKEHAVNAVHSYLQGSSASAKALAAAAEWMAPAAPIGKRRAA